MARSIQKNKWAGRNSRLRTQARNNLGTIMTNDMSNAGVVRNEELDVLDAYYESEQYDNLTDWEEATKQSTEGEHVPVRDRKPRIIYALPKVLCEKVGSKLTGSSMFPKVTVEDDPEDTEFFRIIQKATGFRRHLVEPVRRTLSTGSCFVRFYLVEGSMMMEWYKSKYCYPKFDKKGELEELDIKYVYADADDKDQNGKPKMKWYRLLLTKTQETLFDNPEYQPGNGNPTFTPVEVVSHDLGWVQGEWFSTAKEKHQPDGPSIYGEILEFIDDMNYSLSQSSQAIGYNQEPQLGLKGVDEDEMESLVRSSTKAWGLGKEGAAQFIESTMKGVEVAEENRGSNRNKMLDVVRVVMHDPEKIVGSASSGKALEILHGPLVELVDDLRTILEPCIVNLLVKMALTMVELTASGEEIDLEIPKGFTPDSVDITLQWPAIFPLTLDDISKKATSAQALAMGNIVSRESLTRWLAPDLGIENVEEELQKIASQPPPPNPFGDSFGGP